MADDYYSMGGDEHDDSKMPPHDEGKEEMEGESALLPKSILAGKEFNVGDEVVLEIVAMHDDEIEVKYAPEKPKGEKGESEMDQAEGRLSSMAGPGRGNPGPDY